MLAPAGGGASGSWQPAAATRPSVRITAPSCSGLRLLKIERITSDEEIAWMRRIFEHIFSPEQAQRGSAPVDRSGTRAEGEPEERVDWLFCDIACYPSRLLRLVERWRAAGLVKTFVCTLKFQGATDHDAAAAYAALPGATLLHLHHNKHELTLLLSREP